VSQIRMRVAGVVLVLLALASAAAAQPAPDAGLSKGIAQVQDGYLDDAVTTLNDAVRRLSAVPVRKDDLAQAYLWLGIAYAQLDSEKSGRASFREALRLDPRLSLAEGWPPKVSRLFAAVRAEAAPPAAAPRAAAATATPPPGDSLSPEEDAVYKKYRYHADVYEFAEAEAVLRDWMARNPRSARACGWLAEFMFASFYERPPRFDDGMAIADRCIALDDPKNPTSRQTLAQKYWEMAYHDASLTDEQRDRYADQGLKYVDQALKINPNLIDSVVFKGLLLRSKAQATKDPKKQKAYLAEAERLRTEALELKKSGKGEFSGAPPAGPPLPRPVAVGDDPLRGIEPGPGGLPAAPPPVEAVRVGGQIKEPRKTKHVDVVYPEIAKSARVQGVVIMECTISPTGKVVDVKVLKGIPLLDFAAIEAVKQWEYAPTLLNGVPVAVIMTVTSSFTLR